MKALTKTATAVALAALPLLTLAASTPAAANHTHTCAVTRDGWRPANRTACYKSCLSQRIRAYCNRWCDRNCRH